MPAYPASFDAMLAAWNERDMSAIRSHLNQAMAHDVEFIDPTIETHGIDEFETNVRDFRAKYAEGQCIRTSGVDTHHQWHRYGWEIRVGTRVIVTGFDVVETDTHGKVKRVLGFFGPLPRVEA
jgi:hypothetical protein